MAVRSVNYSGGIWIWTETRIETNSSRSSKSRSCNSGILEVQNQENPVDSDTMGNGTRLGYLNDNSQLAQLQIGRAHV